MRFASIVGARPQFIKIAPVSALLRQHHEEVIIHTGQHYDYMLSATFFKELSIPEPDYSLECGSGAHGAQTGKMLAAIEQVLIKEQPDLVIVYGDTNSTLAAALAAAKLHTPIAHIEAGLRSFNRAMPEEINRIVTDHISDQLFCPTESAARQLQTEGITQGVSVVGDVMYDTLLSIQPRLADHAGPLLTSLGLTPHNYILTTMHRAANTDDVAVMRSIATALNKLEMPVLFPIHPRTKSCLQRYQIQLKPHVHLLEPVGYFDMLALQSAAYRILTDSGGIQKEAFLLGVPCITLREETEWIETVESGWNILAGSYWRTILAAVDRPTPQPPRCNPFGHGDAAQRIVQSWQ